MAPMTGLDRMSALQPPFAADPAQWACLPLGSAGDLAAARLVARTLLYRTDAVAAGELALRTLVLTAACLHAAHVARDDVELPDVIEVLRRLQSGASLAAGLEGSPLPFVRYVAAELRALSPVDASATLEGVLASLASPTPQSGSGLGEKPCIKSLDGR